MAVWLAAMLTFGLYASAVPVKFALVVRAGGDAGFGAGTSLFEGRFALRRARLRAGGRKKRLPWRRAGRDLRKYGAAWDMLRRLLRDTRLESLRASGRLGLADAAQTALACGLLRAAEGALGARLAPGAVRFRVEPDFSGGGCAIEFAGMFSISAGHIIRGALMSAGEYAFESTSRRIREWTGIPLKTS